MKNTRLIFGVIVLIAAAVFQFASCKPGGGIRDTGEPFRIPQSAAYVPTALERSVLSNLEPDYVFDIDALPTITVTVTSNEWNKMLHYIDMNCRTEETVSVDFTFEKNGKVETVSNVGFRIRGNTSRNRPEYSFGPHNPVNPKWSHAHFRISFDGNIDGQRFHGLRALNLKWFKDDPNYCREIYCYDLFRRFGVWTAERASYTKLYIKIAEDPKPAYFGVYGMIEPVDRSYLRDRFASRGLDNGNLWKCLWGATMEYPLRSGQAGFEYVDPYDAGNSQYYPYDFKACDSSSWSNKFAAFTNEAVPQLRQFISDLNRRGGEDFVNWVTNAMDVDLFLKTYAVSVMVGMWDDYWANNGNNYYFYFDKAGKAYFIPYDYDNSMGISLAMLVGNSGTQDPLNWGERSNKPAPLIEKLLNVPDFRERYKFYLCQLIEPSNHLFAFPDSTNRIRKWEAMVEPFVKNDTGGDMTLRDSSGTSWAQLNYYYLLKGGDSGGAATAPGANYFRTRVKTVCDVLGLDYRHYQR